MEKLRRHTQCHEDFCHVLIVWFLQHECQLLCNFTNQARIKANKRLKIIFIVLNIGKINFHTRQNQVSYSLKLQGIELGRVQVIPKTGDKKVLILQTILMKFMFDPLTITPIITSRDSIDPFLLTVYCVLHLQCRVPIVPYYGRSLLLHNK